MANISITINTSAGSVTRDFPEVADAQMARALAYFNAIAPGSANDAQAFRAWAIGIWQELKQDVRRYEQDQARAAAADGVGDIEEV